MFYSFDNSFTLFIFFINLLLSFWIIFLERKSPQSTFAWLLALWVFPVVGFLLYLFLSQNLTRRKIYRYNTPEETAYEQFMKQWLLPGPERFEEEHPELIPYKSNIEFHTNVAKALYTCNNDVSIYVDGHQKFEALFKAIQDATVSIHLEYYIIKNDELGKTFMALLTKKANEGVEVRLLFDEMGGRYLPHHTLKQLKNAGGEYGRFFPTKLRPINLRTNYRDHRKIGVIDGRIAFIGGYNVGDEYLGKKKKMGYWRDTHLKITGYAVYELQRRFFLDWRTSGNTDPIDDDPSLIHRYYPDILVQNNGSVGIQIVSSGPDDSNQTIKQGFLRMIMGAEKIISIQSPYFVLDESIMEALKVALLSGVRVRIMIPNKPDHIFIYWATLSYVGEMLPYGAEVYIYNHGFLHSKVITVDDKIAAVGSCNFDIRSFSLNFESNAFIYDIKISKALRQYFDQDINKSIRYDQQMYNHRPRRIKMKESISRLFGPVL
ncbi:MAG: cardiolipin synthase [Eubacteriaceae bacterium]|nr:cardiolipin synthase [Eubacteriaceae bacterium]